MPYKSDILKGKVRTARQLLGNFVMVPRQFSSGKVGFNCSQAMQLLVAKEQVRFQVSVNLTAAHSEGWDQEKKDLVLKSAPTLVKDLIGGLALTPREFSSGKVGYGASEAIQMLVGDESVRFQASVNVTAAHSESWDAERPAAEQRDEAAAE
jgi:hypothetical protein